jgi:hypothetical protein
VARVAIGASGSDRFGRGVQIDICVRVSLGAMSPVCRSGNCSFEESPVRESNGQELGVASRGGFDADRQDPQYLRRRDAKPTARQRSQIVNFGLWGTLTLLALALVFVFGTLAFIYVRRLETRESLPIGDEIGSAKAVVRKVRKREAMSVDELEFAKQLIGARSSWMTLCIPAALFSVGCFYVFGSLYHLHGATPSERTFLGVFPMLAAINFTTQILRSARLKRRLRRMS